MARLAWIAAGVAAGALGALAWRSGRGRHQLGATTRRGERSGAIEVPDEQITKLASKVIASFQPCGPNGDMLTPQGSRFAPRGTSVTTARGEMVNVMVTSEPVDARGQVSGQLETTISSSGLVRRTIQIFPSRSACWPRSLWGPRVREVLAHEMAHVVDPAVEQNVWRRKSGKRPEDQNGPTCAYYNSPTEVTAHLAEIEYELRSKVHSYRSGRELMPGDPLELLQDSAQWQAMERCLTPANRRRFLRMGAILYKRIFP